MKKVYVLVAALFAALGALSIGSTSFASSDSVPDSVPTDDTVPATDDTVVTTTISVPSTDASTTTSIASSSTAASTTTVAQGGGAVTTTDAATTTTDSVGSGGVSTSAEVGQEAPTTTIKRVGSDGLLPNTGGGDIAFPLILAGLAAGTGAATLLVRRRSNAS